MTAIELLDKLLRGSAAGGEGQPAPDLRDILGGGEEPEEEAPPPQAAPPSRTPSVRPAAPASAPASRPAGNVLEQWSREAATPLPPASRPAPRWNGGPEIAAQRTPAPPPPDNTEEEAVHLIRAMINAARADGEMDQEEEQKILGHLGQPSQEVVAFIRSEFAKPLDVREFAWSIPLGLEPKVYALTLSVMRPDTRQESGYLEELAHGLRLSPEVRRQVHQQLGLPGPA